MINTVSSAFARLGGNFSKAFLGQPCRKENSDSSLLISNTGNIYKLESVLGTGGLSTVYRATRFSDGKVVALKVANLEKSPEAAGLLEREAAILKKLESNIQNNHIVKVYDSGKSLSGDPYIALELLEGQTLEQILFTNTYLDFERLSNLSVQIAEAIEFCHQQGILHLDIKPANIMVSKIDGKEFVTLFDFGISLMAGDDGKSFAESSSGSLLYASPEQLSEEPCSYATDVYQLALVIFEALTGRLPFEISISGAISYRRNDTPVLLDNDELGDQALPTELRKALENALVRNSKERTPNMKIFAQSLKYAFQTYSSSLVFAM